MSTHMLAKLRIWQEFDTKYVASKDTFILVEALLLMYIPNIDDFI